MAILENWDPLQLPRGSVRAIITLGLLAVLWTLLLRGQPVSMVYACTVLLILGHYFGTRADPRAGEKRKAPLGLPRGSIRTLIIAGFTAVGWLLWRDGRLGTDVESRTNVIFYVAGAMIAGYLIRNLLDLGSRGKATRVRRWYENAKAAAALIGAGVLALTSLLGPEEAINQNAALIAAPVVGFYFGSRN